MFPLPWGPSGTSPTGQHVATPPFACALLALWEPLLNSAYDLAIVGSGFAGSLLAMCAARIGLSVVLLEKDSHPRFAIGESSTPLSNLLLEEIAERYSLPRLTPLTKWGTWQRDYPHLACGLKRGFSFFHHDLQVSLQYPRPESCLHVAASPNDNIADTHWYRADFDTFLVQEARAAGVSFFDHVHIAEVREAEDGILLRGEQLSTPFETSAQFIIDATGPRGFLHRALGLEEAPLPGYPETEALFGHFLNVKQLDSSAQPDLSSQPIYTIDDAAVHHVFEGGWIWVLRFNNGITSAGVAAETQRAQQLGLYRGDEAWRELIAKAPVLEKQFSEAQPVAPLSYTPKLCFRSARITGKRWALLPSAAGFVDPLLSTGFPLTLLGVSRLANIVEHHWASPTFSSQLEAYATKTSEELLATSRLISALYAHMGNFAIFRSLSLLYFAAASFSETARRLYKPHLAQSFLLHDQPGFGEQCRDFLKTLADTTLPLDPDIVSREVDRIIHPIDVAGLGRKPLNFCYPVRAEDVTESAWKLGATAHEAVDMLARAGFRLSVP